MSNMATLNERIRRGEVAIAKAKALGRDVWGWEAHLETLKREARASNKPCGVTVDDVLAAFPGARVTDPRRCPRCSKNGPEWRGRLVKRIWIDGQTNFGCHDCGRKISKGKHKQTKESPKKSKAAGESIVDHVRAA
jgi:hypothetical protein